jgi:hypothetical protein
LAVAPNVAGSITGSQRLAPGSEDALRNLIAELAVGKPNDDRMVPAQAEITRSQLTGLQAGLSQLGAVQSVTFKSVGRAGDDIYDVRFERRAHGFRILLDVDAKIHSAQFSP